MVEIKLHTVIDHEDSNRWMAMWGATEDIAFSLDSLQRIFDENPNEKDFKFNIHCDGGSVSEGLAIYDKIRTSGKNIFCNVEGGCHSMAVVILLAAPKENRTANPNCRALIHKVSAPVCDYATADDLRTLADELDREQNAILDIYADRTGTDRVTLENLMKEEKQRTAQELIDYGFISKINSYSTNLTKKTMSKDQKKSIINKLDSFLNGIKNVLEGAVNYDFTDAEGTVLFTTEKEDDSLVVGDKASPDGTFELTDGRKVTIAEGVVTEIVEPSSDDEEVENLRSENERLTTENTQLREKLGDATNLLTEARNQIGSNYTPAPRSTNTKKPLTNQRTFDDIKNEAKERRTKFVGGNK